MNWVQSPRPLRSMSDSCCPCSLLCTQSASFARPRAALDLRSHAVSASPKCPNIDPLCNTLPARSLPMSGTVVVCAFTVSDIHRTVIIRDRQRGAEREER